MDTLSKRNSTARLQLRLARNDNDADTDLLNRGVGIDPLRVSRDVLLDESSVSSASVLGPGRCISLKFTEAGNRKFAEITGANIGRQLAIVFDGKLMAEPAITAAIKDGNVLITGNFTEGKAEALAKAITTAIEDAAEKTKPASPASEIQEKADGPDSRRHPVTELFINNHKFGTDNGCAGDFPSSGQSTCGHSGHVSEVTWKFLRTDSGGDVYQFTRKYPIDATAAKTDTKEVTYAGKALTLWEDDNQKIILPL